MSNETLHPLLGKLYIIIMIDGPKSDNAKKISDKIDHYLKQYDLTKQLATDPLPEIECYFCKNQPLCFRSTAIDDYICYQCNKKAISKLARSKRQELDQNRAKYVIKSILEQNISSLKSIDTFSIKMSPDQVNFTLQSLIDDLKSVIKIIEEEF